MPYHYYDSGCRESQKVGTGIAKTYLHTMRHSGSNFLASTVVQYKPLTVNQVLHEKMLQPTVQRLRTLIPKD